MSIASYFFAIPNKAGSSVVSQAIKLAMLISLVFGVLYPDAVSAQTGLPLVNVSSDPNGATEYSLTLQVLILMTVLTLLPSLLIMMTSFVRIIIVMSLLRQAIGTAQTPPNTVLVGIALFLTFFIMSPVFETVYEDAFVPYVDEEISAEAALDSADSRVYVDADSRSRFNGIRRHRWILLHGRRHGNTVEYTDTIIYDL
jgi:flagellar biosynthesis protein FliP